MAAVDAELTLSGFDPAIIALARIAEAANPGNATRALTTGALVIQNLAKAKVRKKTNTLGRSIHTEPTDADGDTIAAVQVGTNVVYAAQVEFGGDIVPKTKKYLAFKIGDDWVFTKKVHQEAKPYLRPALAEGATEAIATTGRALQQFITLAAST